MPLEFVGDAIALSGEYGSKRKTEIISVYYRFWLSVVARNRYVSAANIIEMDAGTGELHFKDTGTTSLGSAGHALDLRYNSTVAYAKKLHIVLVEEDIECKTRMDNVISRRWPKATLTTKIGKMHISQDMNVTRFDRVDDFLKQTSNGADFGISLFYFDPLLSVDWKLLDGIAKARIVEPYKTGTEFLVFFFTSDWLTGRKDPYFHILPRFNDESKWTSAEKESGDIADQTFGCRDWLSIVASSKTRELMESELVNLYKNKLRKWFRFVIPLPFVPKSGQIYHVFCCSNYDVGMGVVRSIYTEYMQPYGLEADNVSTFQEFKNQHTSLISKYGRRKKPPEWRILWHVMRNCPDGLCDTKCENLQKIAGGAQELENAINWLDKQGYLLRIKVRVWPWSKPQFPIYEINWTTAKTKLNVERPAPPTPLKPP